MPTQVIIGQSLSGGGGTSPPPPPPPPPPSTGLNQLANPSAYGKGDASNCFTGVLGALAVFNGNFATTSDGQIIDHMLINGNLNVLHKDVQVNYSVVNYTGGARAVHDEGSTNGRWTALHSKFISANPSSPECLYVTRGDFDYVELMGGQDNTKPFRGFVTYNHMYMHDPLHPAGAHSDVLQWLSGGYSLLNSTLVAYTGGNIGDWAKSPRGSIGGPNNSCIQIGGTLTGPLTSMLADNCLFDGGNYTVQQFQNIHALNFPISGTATVSNGRFGPDYRYGTHLGVDPVVGFWTNNVNDADNSPALGGQLIP